MKRFCKIFCLFVTIVEMKWYIIDHSDVHVSYKEYFYKFWKVLGKRFLLDYTV